jgi:hypothetical protein
MMSRMTLAMKLAAAGGQVETLAPPADPRAPFGIRVVLHATKRGPRHPPSVSETVIDGIIAAFHAGLGHGPATTAVAAAPAPRLPGMTAPAVEALAAGSLPGPLFTSHALTAKGTCVQINPCDQHRRTGEVIIHQDADGPYPQISGELFALRSATALQSSG